MLKKSLALLLSFILLSLSLCSCGTGTSDKTSDNSADLTELDFTAMDTYITLKVECKSDVLDGVKDLVTKLSDTIDCMNDSELSKLNSSGSGECSDNLYQALFLAMTYYNKTGAAFNPGFYELKKLWNINSDNKSIPSADKIKDALKSSDCSKIINNGKKYTLNGAKLDLGGIGKGLAADNAVQYLSDKDVNRGILSFGGTIAVMGKKSAKEQWTVAVQDPRGENSAALGNLKLANCFVSTSGDYQQYEIIDGKRYHHIFGENGYPTDNGIISVSIVSSNGAESDALSTALMVMGKDRALQYCDEFNTKAIIVTSDKKVTITQNLKNKFELINKDYTLEIYK